MTRLRRYERWQVRLLLLPYALGLIVLFLIPAVLSLALAFFRYDALSPPVFIGDLNFILATTDSLFRLSIQNSLALVILPAPLRVAGAFLLARLLLRGGRWLNWARAAVFVPSLMPGAAYALAWLWILNPRFGPLNLLLRAVGVMPPDWLVDPAWAKPGIALALIWTLGEGFLVALAALHDIPDALDDAARVDGAGTWAIMREVTLPLMAPVLLLLVLRDTILLLQESFTTVWLMTQGGPYYATYTLPLFIYEQGFDLLSFGTASATLWVLYLLTGVLVALILIIARQWQIGMTDEQFLL